MNRDSRWAIRGGLIRVLSAWIVTVVLVGCGGGSGSDDETPASRVATVNVAAAAGPIRVGQTVTLTAEARDSSGAPIAGARIDWTSSNTNVATISGGVVTAVAPGTTTITANASGVTSTPLTLTVIAAAQNRVVIDKASTFFSAVGQSAQLNARIVDPQGNASAAPGVVWRSSAPDKVAVDTNGRVVAMAIGSATITAEVAGLRSAPTLAIVAEPKPGALLVTDDQVVTVSAPTPSAAAPAAGVGARYEVTLQNVSVPAVGTLLLAAESAPVAGKVVATRQEAAGAVATVEIVPLHQLFSQYDISWRIDLSAFELQAVPPRAAASSRQSRLWDQRMRAQAAKARPLDDEFAPFRAWDCDAGIKAKLIGEPPINLSLSNGLELVLDDRPGYSKHALEGTATIEGSAGFVLKAGFAASGHCNAQGQLKVPIAGWASVVVMPAVRFGIGAELDGKVLLVQGELGVKGSVGVAPQIGWECGGAQPECHGLSALNPFNKFETKSKFPDEHGMQADISAHFYVVAGLDASIFLGAANAGIVEARYGPKQSFNLAFEVDQIDRRDYASSYELKVEGVIEPGGALKKAIEMVIDDDAVGVSFSGTLPPIKLSESPKGTLSLSTQRVNPGTPVTFTVDFAPPDSVAYFLLDYNVTGVELYRKRDDESEFSLWKSMSLVSSHRATYRWTPELADAGKYEFAALVNTQLPTPLLEIAANSIAALDVSCFSAAQGRAAATAAQCTNSWHGTATGLVKDTVEFTATLNWELDPERNNDPNRAPSQVFYKPKGSVKIEFLVWKNLGCTTSPSVFDRFDTPSMLVIDGSTDPPTYIFGLQVFSELTINCPDSEPMTIPGTRVLNIDGSGKLNEQGVIEGSNVTPQGTATWGFSPGGFPSASAARR